MKSIRNAMGILVSAVIILSFLSASSPGAEPLSPKQAMENLIKGNARYVSGKNTHPRITDKRRKDTSTEGQHPFATIITCSDSRLPVEIIFDQGIGDIFVIRVAGNVCDTDEIGSIEYGVDHLETPVFVVLGHTKCGAVTAVATDAELHGSIPNLVDNIRPAVERAHNKLPSAKEDELVLEAIKENVWQSIEDLLTGSGAVRSRMAEKKLIVAGALYDIEKGTVEWMGRHPEEKKFLKSKAEAAH